jgi:hypothetical protein
MTKADIERLAERYAGLGHGPAPNEYADAPRWHDIDAQLEYMRERFLVGWCLMFPYRTEEELAVAGALLGKPEKLAALIRQPNPRLAPSTWVLVAEFIEGKRNLVTGRLKDGKGGAPQQSEKLRRAHNRAHQAAEIFFVIRDTLPWIYPNQKKAQIRDRALLLAAKLKRIRRTSTIQNYLDKPKAERLPYRIYGYHEGSGWKWWSPDLLP